MLQGRRAVLTGVGVLVITALSASSAAAARTVGPPVKAAGVGTEAARSSPKCEASTGLTKMNFTARPPCVRPFGAARATAARRARGVAKDAIKVVVLVPDPAQQEAAAKEPGATPPVDQATGSLGTLEDGFRDFFEVFAHWTETWGREVELEFVNPSGADETAQRADALKVAEMEPFAVDRRGRRERRWCGVRQRARRETSSS